MKPYKGQITHDLQNRQYKRLSDVHPNDTVQVDADFTCIPAGTIKVIRVDEEGAPYVRCEAGRHYLEGQLDSESDALIGIYPYKPLPRRP